MKILLTAMAILACAFALHGCSGVDKDAPKELRLSKSSFSNLNGWKDDNHTSAFHAFLKSCDHTWNRKTSKVTIGAQGASYVLNPLQMRAICNEAELIENPTAVQAKTFFEAYFTPWQARANYEDKGLFTGYYEPTLYGSKERGGKYQTPLYSRPSDLVTVDLGLFNDDLKGKRIAGRVNDGKLYPFEDRKTIDRDGIDPSKAQVLAWVDDPIDVFFLHIQGSGSVVLDDGTRMRVGYDGHNGHSYYAIGREMVKRDGVDPKTISLQAIKAWLEKNPDIQEEVFHTNPSYIFFRKLDTNGSIGGEGVVLTARRSLAVDHGLYPYGMPIWLDADAVTDQDEPIKRLMVGQDTGGAIKGPVRGDVFWGSGDEALRKAGQMKSKGSMWLLLPKLHDDAS